MGFFKSFAFNHTVMGLLVSACLIVAILDYYFEASQAKVVNFAALQVAETNLDLLAKMSRLYMKGQPASPAAPAEANAVPLSEQLSALLKEGGGPIEVHVVIAGAQKTPFEVDAFSALSKDPAQPYYVLDKMEDHSILRYAVTNTIFPTGNDKTPSVLELDISMSEFENLKNKEDLKTIWVLVGFAVLASLTVAIFVGYIRVSAEKLADEQAKDLEMQRQLTAGYERFFPHQFLDLLQKKSIIEIKLGDQVEKRMTVLFADVRNFTTIIEKKSPADSFKFINDYLAEVGPLVRKHAGFIDKYIGDAIMGLFEKPDDALEAIIEIMGHLRQTANLTKGAIEIGAGLHCGSLMVGTIGEAERMDGTVISDIVNTASRLEELNKAYGTHVIVSQQFLDSLQFMDKFRFRFVDHIYAKGKMDGVKIYEVFDVDPPELIEKKNMTKPDFDKAIEFYRGRKFQEAKDLLLNCQKIIPEDALFSLFIKRCDKWMAGNLPDNWSPITHLSSKDDVDL